MFRFEPRDIMLGAILFDAALGKVANAEETFRVRGAVVVAAGAALFVLDFLSGRFKCVLVLAIALIGGMWLIGDVSGLNHIFAVILLAGGLVGWGLRRELAPLTAATDMPGF